MEENLIYLLYSCNAWKERASMHLVMTSTNREKIINQIVKEAKAGDMELDQSYFRRSKEGGGIEEINNYLSYGCVEIVEDGEVQ